MKKLRRTSRTLLVLAACLFSSLTGAVTNSRPRVDDNEAPAGGVLVGPIGRAGAMGPTDTNDDFTNCSAINGIVNVPPGGTTAAAGTVISRHTVQNIGATDDIFSITTPSAPAGFIVEISADENANYVRLHPGDGGISLPVAFRAAAIFFVRITAPAGLQVLTGFDTVIRATSTVTPSVSNDTIDRVYTGFIRLERTVNVTNAAVDGGDRMVPGAEIEFAIKYSNISSNYGVGNSLLTAQNLVIYENGNAAPNVWGNTTEHIIGATDTQGGIITGDRDGSTSLKNTITTLEAGQSGVFKFKRRVK